MNLRKSHNKGASLSSLHFLLKWFLQETILISFIFFLFIKFLSNIVAYAPRFHSSFFHLRQSAITAPPTHSAWITNDFTAYEYGLFERGRYDKGLTRAGALLCWERAERPQKRQGHFSPSHGRRASIFSFFYFSDYASASLFLLYSWFPPPPPLLLLRPMTIQTNKN